MVTPAPVAREPIARRSRPDRVMRQILRLPVDGPTGTAEGARKWNDANVLALSLRTTSEALLEEILDAWFAGAPSPDDEDRQNVDHLAEMEDG